MSDRFSGSTLAYQGYGRGLDDGGAAPAGRRGPPTGLAPDLSILVDVPVEVAQARLAAVRARSAGAARARLRPAGARRVPGPGRRPTRRTGSWWTARPIRTALTAHILERGARDGWGASGRTARERRRDDAAPSCAPALFAEVVGQEHAVAALRAAAAQPGARLSLPRRGGERRPGGGARASRPRSCVPRAGAGPAGPAGARWRAATPISTSSIAAGPR